MKTRVFWTDADISFLKKVYPFNSNLSITKKFEGKFSRPAINSKAKILHLRKDKSYNKMLNSVSAIPKEKIDFFKRNYTKFTNHGLAKKLGIGESTVQQLRRRFGLSKENEGRFKSGHVPWTLGKKGIHFSRATEFKKGQKPVNTLYDGAITFRKGIGYFVRISLKKWLPLQHFIWLQHHVEIPKGFCVRIINPSQEITFKNLVLISRKENMKLNTIHRFPEELIKDIHAVAKLKRTIRKIYEKQNH